jgi:hypothetical protein
MARARISDEGVHGDHRSRSLREDVAGASGLAELLEIEKILRAPGGACPEHEVAAFSQIVRLLWVERELGRVEVARAEVVRLDDAQHVR